MSQLLYTGEDKQLGAAAPPSAREPEKVRRYFYYTQAS